MTLFVILLTTIYIEEREREREREREIWNPKRVIGRSAGVPGMYQSPVLNLNLPLLLVSGEINVKSRFRPRAPTCPMITFFDMPPKFNPITKPVF